MQHTFLKYSLPAVFLFLALTTFSCKNNRINQFEQLNYSHDKESKKETNTNTQSNKIEEPADTLRTCDAVNTPITDTNKAEKHKRIKPVTGKTYFTITRVIDGDTFVVTFKNGTDEKVRLIGVNAPESRNSGRMKKQEFGTESKEFLVKFLKGKKVRIEYDVQKNDKYGRTLAYVYLEDGTFLNEYLVKHGYAQVATYPPNVKHKDLFIAAQRYARENQTGLWK